MKLLPSSLIFGLIIAVICIALAQSNENISDALRYDSTAIQQGEYWRLITAHFIHLSWPHLWLNLAGLLLLFVFFGKCLSTTLWFIYLLINALVISLLIYFFNPEIELYVGLSGVLHGLFIIGGIADIQYRKWEGISFVSIILVKVIYEQFAGPLPGSEETAGGPVLVDAHFYGALTGLLLSIPKLRNLLR